MGREISIWVVNIRVLSLTLAGFVLLHGAPVKAADMQPFSFFENPVRH